MPVNNFQLIKKHMGKEMMPHHHIKKLSRQYVKNPEM